MLHLIARGVERLLPAPVHRALLQMVHHIRHRWRKWRKAELRGCSVIISNSAGDILMLRHSYGPDVWAFPGGGIARGEAASDAAIREVREELGVDLDEVEPVATLQEEISGSPQTAYLFAARSDAPPTPDRREIVEARYFAPDALPDTIGKVSASRLAAWRAFMAGGHSNES